MKTGDSQLTAAGCLSIKFSIRFIGKKSAPVFRESLDELFEIGSIVRDRSVRTGTAKV